MLVSAAAGSGKTAVLIERIKQMVLKDNVNIDEFLITTFTNARVVWENEGKAQCSYQKGDRI